MNKISKWLEESLLPIASKLAANKALIAVRDGLSLSLPLILIGSLFMIIASFPVPGWEEWLGESGFSGYLWKAVNSSFGLMGLTASFGIAESYVRQHGYKSLPAGIISLSSFIIVTPFLSSGDGDSGIPSNYMGANGIFVAIIVGFVAGLIYTKLLKNNVRINMPDSVPPAVADSFTGIIPAAIIIPLFWLVFATLDYFNLPNLHEIMQVILGKPLGLLGDNIFGTMIVAGLNSLFWFLGLNGGSVVNPIFQPIWYSNLDENILAYQAGEELPNIITQPFMDNFVWIGGGGATLGLVIFITLIARRKNASQTSKTMGPLTLVPGIFNINEPAMFGIPIVLSLALLIPFILAPVANAAITYAAMALELVPKTRAVASWTMPAVISGFLTTGSFRASLLQIVLIVVDVLIYAPFYSIIEKGYIKQEEEEAASEDAGI